MIYLFDLRTSRVTEDTGDPEFLKDMLLSQA